MQAAQPLLPGSAPRPSMCPLFCHTPSMHRSTLATLPVCSCHHSQHAPLRLTSAPSLPPAMGAAGRTAPLGVCGAGGDQPRSGPTGEGAGPEPRSSAGQVEADGNRLLTAAGSASGRGTSAGGAGLRVRGGRGLPGCVLSPQAFAALPPLVLDAPAKTGSPPEPASLGRPPQPILDAPPLKYPPPPSPK